MCSEVYPWNGLHQKSKNVIYGKETYVGEVYEPLVDDQWPHNPNFLSKIAMNDHFQWHWRLTPTVFNQEMVSTRNPRMWSMASKHMWGEVYEPLVDDQWPHNPHFVKIAMNDHFQ